MTDLAEDKVIFQKVKQTQIAQNCSKLQSFKIKSKIAQNYWALSKKYMSTRPSDVTEIMFCLILIISFSMKNTGSF